MTQSIIISIFLISLKREPHLFNKNSFSRYFFNCEPHLTKNKTILGFLLVIWCSQKTETKNYIVEIAFLFRDRDHPVTVQLPSRDHLVPVLSKAVTLVPIGVL